MTALYLDRTGLELRRDHGSLLVYCHSKLERRIPLRLVDAVIVYGNPILHASALCAMAQQACYLVVIPKGFGPGDVMLSRANGPNTLRRLRQYERSLDLTWHSRFAALVLRAKLRAQGRALYAASIERPDRAKPLSDAICHLANTERQLRERHTAPLSQLLGLEGAAAAAYFHAYRSLFPPSLAFDARNRRPPRDPVNACLSLGYTLIHAEAVSAIVAAGLDPSIGFLHAPAHGRESFACDLVEPLRASVDAWVWRLFRQRVLQAAHFRNVQGGCLLGKSGRRAFYEQFEELRLSAKDRLRRMLRAINRDWNPPDDNALYLSDTNIPNLPQTDPLPFAVTQDHVTPFDSPLDLPS